jgi:hypothetical protein
VLSALTASLWVLPAVIVAGIGAWVLLRFARRKWPDRFPEPRRRPEAKDARLRRALNSLPAATALRRSRAARSGWATWLGQALYGLGVFVGVLVLFGLGLAEEEWASVPIAIFVSSAVIAGVLLAVGHDSRGRQTKVWEVAILPFAALAAGWLLGSDNSGSASSPDETADLLLYAALFLLVSGLPLLAGFLGTRGLAALYRSARPTDLMAQTSSGPVPAELAAATDQGRAATILREYTNDRDGRALLSDDQTILAGMGYELTETGEVHNRWTESDSIQALFVRRTDATLAPGPGSPPERPPAGNR